MQLNPNSNNKQMKLSLANQSQRIFFIYQYNNINVTKWTHQKHFRISVRFKQDIC